MTDENAKRPQKRVRDRFLDVCSYGGCTSTVVWDLPACWTHMTYSDRQSLKDRLCAAVQAGTDLSDVILTGVDLSGFDFTGANLSGAFFNDAVLRACTFVDADLRKAFLAAADLSNADLTRANLDGAIFSGATLYNVRLLAVSISFGKQPVNVGATSFAARRSSRRPHVDEHEPKFAERTYRALKSHFAGIGDYDSASWASFSERLMQREVMWRERRFLSWLSSWLFGSLSGYGEKPLRALLTSMAVVIGCAIFFVMRGSVQVVNNPVAAGLVDCLCFSLAAFSGFSLPNVGIQVDRLTRVIVTGEAFAGMFLFGVFIFTLTKRYVAR